ncbi:hypothetical protein IKF63_02320 [Candidatus Saccharibacteria bacterium]|nr:hypothetical protein [Candidatus Saccharibacteria bacterium]
MKTKEKANSSLVRSIGFLALVKGILGFFALIMTEYFYANSGKIDNYSLRFFLLALLFPFSIFLGIYFIGLYLGSNHARFRSKLESLSPSKIPLRKNQDSSPPDSNSIRANTFPALERVPRNRAIFLTLLDISLIAILIYKIPELTFIYLFLLIEFVLLIGLFFVRE